MDGTRSIVSVAVTSTPQLETDTYGAGETILFTVTFNVAVDVAETPVVEFLFDGSEVRQAGFLSGSGSTGLVFHYLVVSGDDDDNGLFIRDESDYNNPDGPIRLDSNDEIKFKDTSTDVPLYWAGRGTQSGHKVDGSRTTGNTAPSFTSSATFDAAENQTTVGTVAATDSDADDSVTGYEITGGADQALFEIAATTGVLTFKSAPNFEDPQDSGTDNIHEVTVRATSGAGTRVMTADQTITVTVTNADEGQSGTVTIDDTTPMVGDELTASTANAADPDGLPDPFAPTWKWYRTPDGGSETEITGETSATYTVVAADLDATLAAKASWTDTGGFANTLASAATSAVAAASALPTLSVGNASATEGSRILFPLTLTAAASENVRVSCTASFETGDTAAAADLSTITTTTGTITAGGTSGTCSILSVQDTIDEDDETFTVTLTEVLPSGHAQLAADPTAKGTIVDDDTAPTVTGVEVTSEPVLETDTYGAGERIEVSVTFSEAVNATSATDFVLSVAGAKRAPLLSGSGTATLVFGYTVAPGDEDDDGIWIGDQDRTLVGNRNGEPQAGAITSTATGTAADLDHAELGTQSGHKVDGSRSIVSVAVSSTPQLESDTYGAGETIQFTVTFNVAVDVDGDPVLKFVLGNSGQVREVDAAYVTGGGGTALVFGYTVVSTDVDNNGIYLRDEQDYDSPDGPVRLDSNDEIEFKDTSTDVPLYWAGRGNHPSHKVDGSRTTGNAAPSFTSSAAFDAAENQTAVGTVAATDSDADDSVTGYAITGGADQGAFSIGATSGVLTFNSAPNFEAPSDTDTNGSYVVTVQATSGAGTREMTADQTITVTVTDVSGEAPGKPAAPMVSAASATSLTVSWLAPSNAGPAITDYDVQYREGTSGNWTDGNYTGAATTATLTGLSENTSHQVQVRATNDEGTGDWSDAGSGTTDANAAPAFSSSAARHVAENTTAVVTVTATDSDADDSVTGYEITGGTDRNLFSIGASDGVLTFKSAPNFEDPKDAGTDNDYVVVVQAASGAGEREKTATQTITVTVTNADEGQSGTVAIDDTTPTVGDELTASTANAADPDGLPDPFAPTWKWYRTPDGGSETEISGETSATYTVVAADLGATLTAKASWTDKGGFANTLSSAPTSAVAAASALPTLSVADAAGTEGGAVTFTVALSPAAAAEVTVDYATSVESDDTATSGTDFTAVAATTLTFAVGDTEKTFTVATTEDTTAEEDETFTVTLSNVSSNAQLAADPTARGTIVDDDLPTLGFSEDSIFIVEERGEIEFKVKLSAESTVAIAVDWETEAGSAEADVDYTEASGTLTFAPGDTEETITVELIDDEILEQLETFTVRLSGTDDALVTLGTSSSIGRIIDRDAATITFAEETTVEEDAGTVTLTLTASAPSTTAYTIDYETEDGTAVAGTDYTAASGTVRFRALQTERTITITVLEDTVEEEPEYFTVKLDDPSHRLVDLASGPPPRVRIVDEIAPAPEDLEAEPVEGSYTSLAVSWDAPRIPDGGPALTGYEVRYRERPDGDWVEAPHAGTARTATLTELEVNTAYEVEVRALYSEMQSVWVRVPGQVRTAEPPPARVRNVRIVNGPVSDGVWSAGERVEVEVVYPVPMVVEKPEDCWSYNADGTCRESGPFVLVVFSDDARPGYGKSLSTPLAPYESGSGTAKLQFAYTVGEDEDGALRVSVADDGILLRGATIRTLEGGEGKPEYTNTRVAQVTVERSGRAWTAGEKVRMKVRFSGPGQYTPPDDPENRDEVVVDDTGGVPTIDLKLGDRVNREQTRTASYESGSRSDTLVFEYEVTAGDGRVGAVEVVADSLAKNGATIRNKEGYDAELDHLGAVQYAQRAALSVADAEATEGVDATLDFVVKLDGVPGEEGVTVAYRTQDGTAKAGSDYEETRGTLTFARGEGVYEKTVSVPITDDAEEDGGETFKLLLSNVTGAKVLNYEAVGTIRNDEAQESKSETESETESKPETPTVDVADARVREAAGATLDFVVTLSGASTDTVTVDYRTVDASAKAGEDYTKREDTLTFDPGETSKTIRVTVLDDAHDEGNEKMTLVLYRASGAIRDDYLAVGIIENSDPMPRAWLARFGRTASDHVVEAIAERWRGGETQRPRTHFTLGGRPASNLFGGGDANGGVLHPAGAGNPALADESDWAQSDRLNAEAPGPAGGGLGGDPVAGRGPAGGGTSGGQAARFALMNALGLPTGDLRDVLMGSSFFYSRPLDEDAGQPGWLGQWSAWGRTAATRFSGADGKLTLNGEVATAILGVDSRRDRWLAGVTLSYSEGEGAYTQPGAGGGGVRSTLTSLNPYVQYRFSERTHLWAVAGYGVGGLTLTPESSESVIDTDLEHAMAAFGGRGVFSVRSSRFGAFEFAVRSDALVTNTVSAASEHLISAAGAASRVRLMLEGSGSMPLGSGGMLWPTLEAGLRYDGGDAETGAGLEIGGGLGYAAGALAVEVRARLLLAHQDAAYEEWGFSGSIRYQPQSGGRGLSVNLGSTWGQAQSGVQSLWTRPDASGLAPVAAMHAAQRFQAELGYGFAGRRAGALWTPYAGIDRSGGRQALRLGVKLALGDNVEAGLEVGRLDSGRAGGRADGIEGPEHAVQLRGSIRW